MRRSEEKKPSYLEALDTVDYKLEKTNEVGAQIQLSLICGDDILMSQTQAFDGGHFLNFAENSYFCELIQTGHIQIHLLDDQKASALGEAPTLCRALASKVEDPRFHFMCWDEIETPSEEDPGTTRARRDQAKILHEMAGTRAPARALEWLRKEIGDNCAKRWEALHRVDRALSKTAPQRRYQVRPNPHRHTLSRYLELEVQAAKSEPDLFALFSKVLSVGGDGRSAYFRAINEGLDLSPKELLKAHEFVNNAYNRVVSASLGAIPVLNASSKRISKILLESAEEGSAIREMRPAPHLHRQLTGLSWRTTGELVQVIESPSIDDEDKARRLLDLNKFAAEEIVRHQGPFTLSLGLMPEQISETVDEGLGLVVKHSAGLLRSATRVAAETVAHTGSLLPYAFALTHFAHMPLSLLLCVTKLVTGRDFTLNSHIKAALTRKAEEERRGEIINLLKKHPAAGGLNLD